MVARPAADYSHCQLDRRTHDDNGERHNKPHADSTNTHKSQPGRREPPRPRGSDHDYKTKHPERHLP